MDRSSARTPASVGLRSAVACSLLVVFSAACASSTSRVPLTRIEGPRQGTSAETTNDIAYQAAAKAIERREYGAALDLLQSARARSPRDVRVLNAFGVVYDKLGRFDLSARYYAQAAQIDPGSQILANNLAYSRTLQGIAAEPAPQAAPHAMAANVRAAPQPIQLAAYAPPMLTKAEALVVPVQRHPILRAKPAPAGDGGPIILIDASGRAGGAEPVRLKLVHLGWWTHKPAVRQRARVAHTTIRYPKAAYATARALWRSLPAPVTLVACSRDCQSVQLTIGMDVLDRNVAARGRRHS